MRRILPASDTALLVEEADLEGAMRLHAALEAAALPGVAELVPAARTVLVRFDPRAVSAGVLTERIAVLASADAASGAAGSVVIPVSYDGEDLGEVAGILGVTPDELVARHLAATWRVAFTGFAPGFGYLAGDDALFDVPRRPSPRPRIPAGSVALAGAFSGVYPRESPGGWQLIGRTDAVMWDLARPEPALLAPGTTVRFERSPRERIPLSDAAATTAPASDSASDPPRHAVEVVRPGLQLVIEDGGRPGHAALGVSASGIADRGALRDANRAVGNDAGAAAFELAGGGAVLRFRGDGVIALAGAPAPASLVRADGAAYSVGGGEPSAVEDGDELTIGPATSGLRVVVAVRGGIDLAPGLGSLSSDTLAGLGALETGGDPLAAGAVIPLRGPSAAPRAVDRVAPRPVPASGDLVELRVVLGPRDDWFTPAGVRTLLEQEWTVTPRSDRVGIRLAGETPLERATPGELPSEGAVTGAIQVPPDGQPVLFLPDHPLTGGYPIIGAVVDADLDIAGQLPPGARIRFRATTGD
ncbi:urea amidolyase family protein [Microbacterium indicum]|uniref:5-oxoprolinase subunit B/C family protein n=1 Tax=Microbacterium indicum TaxID=358100 RepID=UPI000410142C|nr:urea amidolyase family protein [Microbacterium indicum]